MLSKYNMAKKYSTVLCLFLFSYQVNAEQAIQQQSQSQKLNCICTKQWEPVCGVNGRTYGNLCEAHCAKVKVVHKGACFRER